MRTWLPLETSGAGGRWPSTSSLAGSSLCTRGAAIRDAERAGVAPRRGKCSFSGGRALALRPLSPAAEQQLGVQPANRAREKEQRQCELQAPIAFSTLLLNIENNLGRACGTLCFDPSPIIMTACSRCAWRVLLESGASTARGLTNAASSGTGVAPHGVEASAVIRPPVGPRLRWSGHAGPLAACSLPANKEKNPPLQVLRALRLAAHVTRLCNFRVFFLLLRLSFVERICKLLRYGGKRLRCSIPPRGAKDHVRLARLRYGGGDAEREQGSCELPAAPRLRACGPPHVPSCIRTTDALPIFSINFSTTTPNGS